MVRSAKSRQQQRRRPPKYEPRDRILIVCEGEKTEKLYFEDARQSLGIHRGQAVVEVKSGEGSNPKNIVETAKKLKTKAEQEGNAFSSVYCVFDRDEHAHYQSSIERAEKLKIVSIKSIPCFEYWVLLHFRDHGAPYMRTGTRTPCECVYRDVKAEWSDYTKGRKRLFTDLQERLPDAKSRAVRRLSSARQDGCDNPSTEMHLLLNALEAA